MHQKRPKEFGVQQTMSRSVQAIGVQQTMSRSEGARRIVHHRHVCMRVPLPCLMMLTLSTPPTCSCRRYRRRALSLVTLPPLPAPISSICAEDGETRVLRKGEPTPGKYLEEPPDRVEQDNLHVAGDDLVNDQRYSAAYWYQSCDLSSVVVRAVSRGKPVSLGTLPTAHHMQQRPGPNQRMAAVSSLALDTISRLVSGPDELCGAQKAAGRMAMRR